MNSHSGSALQAGIPARQIVDADRLRNVYNQARATLLAERTSAGHWVGELSNSALSTATAISALALVQKQLDHTDHQLPIERGVAWLVDHQNADGGWGDTTLSLSNISTTMLCRAAFHLTETAASNPATLERVERWLSQRYGSTPSELAEAVRQRYGKDRTFSVPILTTCALAGLVSWKEVPSLPFELACFPQSWFRFLRLQVVSYALPALIAIGQCVFYHRGTWNPLAALIRRIARKASLRVLRAIQPSSGGYLEAVPLTSFVTLSLASIGQARHAVAVEGVRFLVNSIQPDGSWPIDTNLATWVTTLSINALASGYDRLDLPGGAGVIDWLLDQQYKVRHAYTGAAPGAWAWTPLPGGVPDADDTPGALIALAHLVADARANTAALAGLEWLKNLQNQDGGWPTFCRGWGYLPFDRSGADLTAHVLRGIQAWLNRLSTNDWPKTDLPGFSQKKQEHLLTGLHDCMARGFEYLARIQRADGSWLPLWFGNQHAPDDENPAYGTARVLAAYRDLSKMTDSAAQRAIHWLLINQNEDGGWGGCKGCRSSVEETGLVLEVLVDAGDQASAAVNKGLGWLVEQVEAGALHHPTPIGFYFAKLWYFEKLYPMIFAAAALGRACGRIQAASHATASGES